VIHDFAAFLGIAVLVIVTPGQDTALVIRNALLGGRRTGVVTAAGVSAGQAAWTVATAAGLAAVLAASEPAFTAVKLVGVAYLVLLGLQALHRAVRGGRAAHGRRRSSPGIAPSLGLRQGAVSNLGNPKMALFFTSLLPQFVPGGEASFAGLLVLGLVFCLLTFVWLAAYAVAVARAGDVLRRPTVRRVIDGVTGAVLVAFGIRLATTTRT
jgi:threonine/homoserine/homoserine lactone efflux protein